MTINNNKLIVSLTAVVLSAALVCGCSLGSSSAATATDATETSAAESQYISTGNVAADKDKDETVYVFSGSDGAIKSIIVSDHLHNAAGLETLSDVSRLTNITNVKGSETFTQGENNALTWQANGSDIFYRGESTETLPVTMGISYTLNGKSISPSDLEGKSGKVTIHINYANNETKFVNINGKSTKICVPFLAISIISLDPALFSDITVDNGKVITDGDHSEIIGYAMPGINEIINLSLDNLDIDKTADLPEDVTITMNTTGFKMKEMYAAVNNSVFNDKDYNGIDDLDSMQDDMDKLTDAMSDILDGGDDVAKYMGELYDKTGDLVDGVKELYDGSVTLNNKMGELSDGLQKIVGTDNANSKQLRDGAKQIVDTVFSGATTQLQAELVKSGMSEENAAKVVLSVDPASSSYYVNVLAALSGGDPTAAQIKQADTTIRSTLNSAGLTTADNQTVAMAIAYDLSGGKFADATSALTKAGSMMADAQFVQQAGTTYGPVLATNTNLQGLVGTLMTNYKLDQATAQTVVCTAMAINSANPTAAIPAATEKATNAGTVKAMMTDPASVASKVTLLDTLAAKGALYEANTKLSAVKTQLDSVAKFLSGINDYTNGVDTAASGAKQLKTDGTQKLADNLKTLYDKVQEMRDKVKELYDGTVELRDGLHDFNDDGIQKITDLFNEDLPDLNDRIKAMSDYSKEYTNYSGIASGMSGSVKFIYKLDPIGSD